MTSFRSYTIGFALVVVAAATASCSPQFSLGDEAANGDVAAVQRDLANKIDPNSKVTGEPVLLFAAANGHLDIVRLLLQAGADVKAKDDQSGDTALIAAAGGGHSDLIKPLVAAGADVEARNAMGDTALTLAVELNKPDTVQALIDAGANVNDGFSTPDGPTVLSIYQDQPKHAAVTQVLLRNGAHI
jgi:ankyrin repeat protein